MNYDDNRAVVSLQAFQVVCFSLRIAYVVLLFH